MNPIDPNALPPEDGSPKPWHKPQPQPDGGSGSTDAGSAAGNIIDGAAEVAGGALEAAGEVAGGVFEIAGGCAEGCGGCSAAILVVLFAAAGTAMACFG